MSSINSLSGFFAPASGIVVVDAAFAPMRDFFQASTERVQVGTRTDEAVIKRLQAGVRIPPDVMPTLLVRSHELHHFSQLMSTPLGLLIWRASNTLIVDVDWFLRLLRGCPDLLDVELPLHTWLAGGGEAMIFDYLSNPRGRRIDFDMLPSLLQSPSLIRENLERVASYTHEVLREIITVEMFLCALLERTDVSVGQFARLATDAMLIMDRRSGTGGQVRWRSNLPLETRIVAGTRCSTREILEASARLVEQQEVLEAGRANDLVAWENRSLFAEYKPAFEYLRQRVGDPRISQICVDVALMQPTDPAVALSLGRQELLVEDIHPSFALPRCVEAIRGEFVRADTENLDALASSALAVQAALHKPIDVVRARGEISGRLHDKEWTSDARTKGARSYGEASIRHTHAEFIRALELREKCPSSFACYDGRVPFLRAHIEFYTDYFMFNIGVMTEPTDSRDKVNVVDVARLLQDCFVKTAASEIHLSLLRDGRVPILRHMTSALQGREGAGDDQVVTCILRMLKANAGGSEVAATVFPRDAVLHGYPLAVQRLIIA